MTLVFSPLSSHSQLIQFLSSISASNSLFFSTSHHLHNNGNFTALIRCRRRNLRLSPLVLPPRAAPHRSESLAGGGQSPVSIHEPEKDTRLDRRKPPCHWRRRHLSDVYYLFAVYCMEARVLYCDVSPEEHRAYSPNPVR